MTQDGGDWTVHVIVGVDPDSRLWLLDVWRWPNGVGSVDSMFAFCDLVRQWKPIGWGRGARADHWPWCLTFLDRRMRERSAFVSRRPFPTRGDKAVRAQSIRGRMALDGLWQCSGDGIVACRVSGGRS